MDDFNLDFELNKISSGISLDDILAEFQSEQSDALFSEEEASPDYDSGYREADVKVYSSAADGSDDTYQEYDIRLDPGDAYEYDYADNAGLPAEASDEYTDEYGEEFRGYVSRRVSSDIDYDDFRFHSEYSAELEDEPAPAKPRRRGKIGSMKEEARRFIAQMQSRKSAEPEEDEFPEEPIYGDLPAEFSIRGQAEDEYEVDDDFGVDLSDDLDYPDSPEADLPADTYASGSFDDYGDLDAEGFSADIAYNDFTSDSFQNHAGYEYSEPDYYTGDTEDYAYGQDIDYDADPTGYSESRDYSLYTGTADDIEIDHRFNLGGGRRHQTMTYGSSSVDLAADENYVQVQQSEYNPSQWTPDYDDPLAEEYEDTAPQRKKHKFRFGKKKRTLSAPDVDPLESAQAYDEDTITGFSDADAEPADYAESIDYEDGRKFSHEDTYSVPSFREYLLSVFASVFLRIRGSVTGDSNQTMDDTEEDLGPELTPAAAAKYYGSFIKSLKLRLRISAVLLAVLCYISLGLPVPNMLKYIPVASAFCFALQAAIMLLALDVVTTGVLNAFRLRFGADSLAVLSCLLTGADALVVALSDSAALHTPFCALSSLSVVGLLLASFLSARGLRKAMRVPAIGKRFYAVTGELTPNGKELTLLKSMRSIKGFVHRTEEAGPDENLYVKIGPFVIVFTLLLTIITAAVKHSFSDFLFIFSAILAPAVPFASMLAFSLPFFLGSTRIFKSGGAIAGWSGLCDIGVSKNLIVTDRDLFPESSITMESVRIFADEDAQKVISYAGTMMSASGSSSSACFMDLMEENYCSMKQVDGFEYLPGGGMKGIIEGHVVLCGSTDLMRLMNVKIPFRLTDKTTVLLAIDGILYGIFSLHYEPLPQVRKALVDLMRSNRHPVFAMADFNINPEMLHNTFDIATDGYDFPPYVERFELTKPAEENRGGRVAAIICNEGLGPLTNVADVGRSMYLAIRANVLINALAIVFGILTVFIYLLAKSGISIGLVFVLMVFWALPVIFVSLFAGAGSK